MTDYVGRSPAWLPRRQAFAPEVTRLRSDQAIAIWVCLGTAALFVLSSERFLHWFMAPVLVCGALIAPHAIRWFRGQTDVLDPVAVVGFYGFFFFFLAPLMHVGWDSWMSYVAPPRDWREWLGAMAIVNALGLVVYRGIVAWTDRRGPGRAQLRAWYLRPERLPWAFGGAALIAATLQVWTYQQFGGLDGYIQAFESFDNSFRGWGWIFTVSESCPLLLFLWWAIATKRRGIRPGGQTLLVVLIAFAALEMLFGGFRGSRSNLVFPILWGVGVVHGWFRPLRRTFIAMGVLLLLVFMYAYGFYKEVGRDALRVVEGPAAWLELEETTRRNIAGVVLGDLGRADIQALVLQRTLDPDEGCDYAWGRTYLGAFALLIPASVWSDRPPTKIKEGTECLFGRNSYLPDSFYASNVYGLSGELMLNFGVAAVPLGFALLGMLVVGVRTRMLDWPTDDPRRVFLPVLVALCVVFLSSDLDNDLFFLLKYAGIPYVALWLSAMKSGPRAVPPLSMTASVEGRGSKARS
jgi:hypothetical protein